MALGVCKCLNVTLVCDKYDDCVDTEKLQLTVIEQRDFFFSEKLIACPTNDLKVQLVQPALTGQRNVGKWLLHTCFACGQTTHAVSQDRSNIALICNSILTTQEHVNNLKKSSNFSPVFNLLVPEVNNTEMKENIDTSNFILEKKQWPSAQHAIGTLKEQLNQTLQAQLNTIEETVRQFRDQKYAEFEAYREKAQRDHNILTSIVRKSRGNVDNDGWRIDPSIDNGPPSPLLPPLQRRRLSSIKDAKKASHIVKQSPIIAHDEDSIDAEDIFDIEGTGSRNDIGSDQDDYDSDDGSNEGGIHISRPRGGAAQDIARSLPINMPKFPNERSEPQDLDDEEDPQDIAASIKALARSVHGDVFELPRPRFSTQI